MKHTALITAILNDEHSTNDYDIQHIVRSVYALKACGYEVESVSCYASDARIASFTLCECQYTGTYIEVEVKSTLNYEITMNGGKSLSNDFSHETLVLTGNENFDIEMTVNENSTDRLRRSLFKALNAELASK